MADDSTTIPTAGQDEASTDTSDQALTTEATEAAGAETPPAPAAKEPTTDPYAGLDKLDPAEIIKRHPGVQGHIGTLAERQRNAEIATWQRQQAEQKAIEDRNRAAAERERLARDEPLSFAEQELQRIEDEKRLGTTLARAKDVIEKDVATIIPEEVLAEFAGKTFDGDLLTGYGAFLKAAIPATLALGEKRGYAKAQAEFAAGTKAREAAIEKEVLARHNLAEPTPDLDAGRPPGPNDDATFLREFAAGRTNDHKRAAALTGLRI